MADVNWGELIDDSADAFEILPVGSYRVKVVSANATQSSTNKLMFKTVMEVITGPKTGKTVYNNVTMTTDNKKALFMFFQNMAALGISKDFLKGDPKPSSDQVAAKMVGAVLDIEVDHRPWQGVDRENIKKMTGVSAGTGSVNAMDPGVSVAAAASPVVDNPGEPKMPF